MAVGEHACVSMMAGQAGMAGQSGGCDGVIVGASLDSGVRAGRELLDVPVIGITEAALHMACLLGGRFGLVTLSARSAAVTREMVEGYGLLGRMAGMRWLRSAPTDLLRDPEGAVADLVGGGAGVGGGGAGGCCCAGGGGDGGDAGADAGGGAGTGDRGG